MRHSVRGLPLYDYSANDLPMNAALMKWIGVSDPAPQNDHEWDALVSAFAVLQGVTGKWPLDLHTLPTTAGESLVWPLGKTHYFWPPVPD